MVDLFVTSAEIATAAAGETAGRLRQLPTEWSNALGRQRRDSAAIRVLPWLAAQPIVTADDLSRFLGVAPSRAYAALEQLVSAGVLVPLTDRKRNQVWGAIDVLNELDALTTRIAQAASASGLKIRRQSFPGSIPGSARQDPAEAGSLCLVGR